MQGEVTAVISHFWFKTEIGRIWPGKDDFVCALGRAPLCGRRFCWWVLGGASGISSGLGEAGVEKARAIGQPGGVGEFGPVQHFVTVFTALQIMDVDGLPVAAALGEGVG